MEAQKSIANFLSRFQAYMTKVERLKDRARGSEEASVRLVNGALPKDVSHLMAFVKSVENSQKWYRAPEIQVFNKEN